MAGWQAAALGTSPFWHSSGSQRLNFLAKMLDLKKESHVKFLLSSCLERKNLVVSFWITISLVVIVGCEIMLSNIVRHPFVLK